MRNCYLRQVACRVHTGPGNPGNFLKLKKKFPGMGSPGIQVQDLGGARNLNRVMYFILKMLTNI